MPTKRFVEACLQVVGIAAEMKKQPFDWQQFMHADTEAAMEIADWLCTQTMNAQGALLTTGDALAVAVERVRDRANDLGSLSLRGGDSRRSIDDAQNRLRESVDALVLELGGPATVYALQQGAEAKQLEKQGRELRKVAADAEQKLKKAEDDVKGVKEGLAAAQEDAKQEGEQQKVAVDKAIRRLARVEEKALTVTKEAQTAKEDAESAASDARSALAERGVGAFWKEFNEEAGSARTRAFLWMSVLVVLVLATILIALTMDVEQMPELGDAGRVDWPAASKWFHSLTKKVLVLSMLVYSVTWSSRVCLANFHLAATNKHRALSIQTLEAFRGATADNASKDAVTLEAARAVYEHVPTGYLGKREGGPMPATILERINRSEGS